MDVNRNGSANIGNLGILGTSGKSAAAATARMSTGSAAASDAGKPAAAASSSSTSSRGNWGTPMEFTLACIGYAIGLGNVWRFPHMVYRNGGGAFLVPYFLMVLVIGLPIFFAELFVGQYSGLGPIMAYGRLAPFFQGLGYCTLVVITMITIYYMVIIAWIIFYFYASFQPELAWGSCTNDFNSDDCYSALQDQNCNGDETTDPANVTIFWRKQCTSVASICVEKGYEFLDRKHCVDAANGTIVPVRKIIKRVLASEEYYYQSVLGIGDATFENWGYPRWQLVLCLAIGWLIAFGCLIKGIKSAGKVIYFTALFPYVVLLALLIRGLTLPGAIDGIWFYIQPDWSQLTKPAVWGDAASQTFYSFGIACGSLVSFASYSRFRNNIHTDAVFVSAANVFTAIFAGFAVFSVLGFMAHNLDVPVHEVVQGGPGLAFIAYPEAVLLMPAPHIWAVAFFFMMFILGMGSQFGGIEAICTAVIDHWPHLEKHHWRVTAGVCMFCFVAAIPMTCNGGVYMFTLMDWHTASWATLLIGGAEIVIVSWVYGMKRSFDNLADMGMRMNVGLRGYWWMVWVVVSPTGCVAVFVFVMTDIGATKFSDYVFPQWADALGWMMGASTLAPFIVFVVVHLIREPKKAWPMLFETSPKWMPQECSDDEDPAHAANRLDNEAANPVISILAETASTATDTTTVSTMCEYDQHSSQPKYRASAGKPNGSSTTTTITAGGIDNIAYERH